MSAPTIGSVSLGGSAGNKTIVHGHPTTPTKITAIVGARLNTTETKDMSSWGITDLTNTICHSVAPSFSKRWPYSGETSYQIALYSASTTKVLSFSPVSIDSSDFVVNADVTNSSYPVTLIFED